MELDGRFDDLTSLGRSLQQDLSPLLNPGDWLLPGADWDDLPALDQVATDWATLETATADLATLYGWLTTDLLSSGSPAVGGAEDGLPSYPSGSPSASPSFSVARNLAKPASEKPLGTEHDTREPASVSASVVGDQEKSLTRSPQNSAIVGWASFTKEEGFQRSPHHQPPNLDAPQPSTWADGEHAPNQVGAFIGQDEPTASGESIPLEEVEGDVHPAEMGLDREIDQAKETKNSLVTGSTVGSFADLAARLGDRTVKPELTEPESAAQDQADAVGETFRATFQASSGAINQDIPQPPHLARAASIATSWSNPDERSPGSGVDQPQLVPQEKIQAIGTMDSHSPPVPIVGGFAELAARLTGLEQRQTNPLQDDPHQNPIHLDQATLTHATVATGVKEVGEAQFSASQPSTPENSNSLFPESKSAREPARWPGSMAAKFQDEATDWLAASSPPTASAWAEATLDELDVEDIMDAIARTITRDYHRFYGS